MIARLNGEIADIRNGHVVIMVGGVGYLVAVAQSSGFALGTTVSLYTHLAVRENALDLYGFTHEDELRMFEELIKLPKIGPKTAIQILSQADLKTLVHAVTINDPSYLSKLSGIGKKSAEKIVAGLKDIFDTEPFMGTHVPSKQNDDVIDALLTLGYSQRDVLDAIQQLPEEITDTNGRLKQALKILSK
jgi:holliday junction DNA helicase RuvA